MAGDLEKTIAPDDDADTVPDLRPDEPSVEDIVEGVFAKEAAMKKGVQDILEPILNAPILVHGMKHIGGGHFEIEFSLGGKSESHSAVVQMPGNKFD